MHRAIYHSSFLFSLAYGLLNLYFFFKLRCLLPSRGTRAALAAFVLFMACGIAIMDVIEHTHLGLAVLIFGLAAYGWLAGMLWFGFFACPLDAWNLALTLGARHRPGLARWRIGPRPALAAAGALTALMLLYGVIEARTLRLEEVRLRSPRFQGPPLRILQLSDVHLGLLVRGRRLDQIVALAERARPDLIVSTGDLLDGTGEQGGPLHQRLAALRPPLGKFAITGNHEFYNGLAKSLAFHEAAGFRMLRGEAIELAGGRLRLAGIDDSTGLRFGLVPPEDEPAILGPPRAAGVTLLLKHQPVVNRRSLGRFDLMLSGHLHRGQILPFGMLAWAEYYPFFAGFYQLPGGSRLRISRGAGTWGPPMRVGSPPEITLITLEPGS